MHRKDSTRSKYGIIKVHLLKAPAWAAGFGVLLAIVLTFWMPIDQAAKLSLGIYFILYLPGYFFLKQFYQSGRILEQNVLSIAVGIALLIIISYYTRLYGITQTAMLLIVYSAVIILGSLAMEFLKKRKILSAKEKR